MTQEYTVEGIVEEKRRKIRVLNGRERSAKGKSCRRDKIVREGNGRKEEIKVG